MSKKERKEKNKKKKGEKLYHPRHTCIIRDVIEVINLVAFKTKLDEFTFLI